MSKVSVSPSSTLKAASLPLFRGWAAVISTWCASVDTKGKDVVWCMVGVMLIAISRVRMMCYGVWLVLC